MNPRRRMAVLDFDGTLLRSDGTFAAEDLAALRALGDAGHLRVIATGRSPFSYRRALAGRQLPVDDLVLSSGAAVLEGGTGRVLRGFELDPEDVARAAAVFDGLGLDYMVHAPVPENHRFAWVRAAGTPDFDRRIALYPDHSRPLTGDPAGHGPAAQLLAIAPGDAADAALARVRAALPDLSVIRATSPIDHASVWIEVFRAGVSKATAAAWLAAREGIDRADTLAVGNDWNDLDLLRWAGTSFVVANAPAELRAEFPVVAGHDEAGVAEAIGSWLTRRR